MSEGTVPKLGGDDYIPSSFGLQCLEEAERLDRYFKPVPSPPRRRGSKPCRKKKSKQPTLLQVVKKMNQNFQGFAVGKCRQVPGHGDLIVYIPTNYGCRTKKRHGGYSARDKVFCQHCFLQPCSTIEYKDDMKSVIEEDMNWLKMSEKELLEKVRTRYRVESMKTYNKTWVTKSMPTNNDIPKCALVATRELVDDTGYDSLVDDSPFKRDAEVNFLYNKAERLQEEMPLSDEEDVDDEDDTPAVYTSEDDLPLASLLQKNLPTKEKAVQGTCGPK